MPETEAVVPETSAKRGPYAKTAAVRRRIVDAALDLFGTKGFRATTMKEIALNAEISQRGMVHHFPSKEDLLFAALRRYEEEGASVVATTGVEHLAEGLRDGVPLNRRNRALLELQQQLSTEAIAADHPAHEWFSSRLDHLRMGLAAEFAAVGGTEEGESDDVAERRAAMYVALLDGLQLQWLYRPESVDVERCLDDFLQMTGVIAGRAAEPGSSRQDVSAEKESAPAGA